MTSNALSKLREKKVNLINELENVSKNDRDREINEMIIKHGKIQKNVNLLMNKQTEVQEEDFKKKMDQRRERSLSRSMNKSMERRSVNKKAIGEGKKPKEVKEITCEDQNEEGSNCLIDRGFQNDKKKNQNIFKN